MKKYLHFVFGTYKKILPEPSVIFHRYIEKTIYWLSFNGPKWCIIYSLLKSFTSQETRVHLWSQRVKMNQMMYIKILHSWKTSKALLQICPSFASSNNQCTLAKVLHTEFQLITTINVRRENTDHSTYLNDLLLIIFLKFFQNSKLFFLPNISNNYPNNTV